MNILVTGGAGFIGSFLVDRLMRDGHKVRIIDNLEPQAHQGKKPKYLNKDAEFIRADICDEDALDKALKSIGIVFHEAAMVGVGQSMYEILKYRKDDIRHCFADVTKIKRVLNWKPIVKFEEGMKELVEWSSAEESKDYFDLASKILKAKGIL